MLPGCRDWTSLDRGVVHLLQEQAFVSAANAQLICVSLPLRGRPQTGPAAAARETAWAKPLPPGLIWPKIHLISCPDVIVKIATRFLNFRITVDKSVSQPLVIGVFFFPKNDLFYSFFPSSTLFCHLAATSFYCKNHFVKKVILFYHPCFIPPHLSVLSN